MIPTSQIRRLGLREVKGLMVAYWLITGVAGFNRTYLTPMSLL